MLPVAVDPGGFSATEGVLELGPGPSTSSNVPELTLFGWRRESNGPSPTKEDVGNQFWRGGAEVDLWGCTVSERAVRVDPANAEGMSVGPIDCVETSISIKGLKNFQAGGSTAWRKIR